jgi:hypothetical protein
VYKIFKQINKNKAKHNTPNPEKINKTIILLHYLINSQRPQHSASAQYSQHSNKYSFTHYSFFFARHLLSTLFFLANHILNKCNTLYFSLKKKKKKKKQYFVQYSLTNVIIFGQKVTTHSFYQRFKISSYIHSIYLFFHLLLGVGGCPSPRACWAYPMAGPVCEAS